MRSGWRAILGLVATLLVVCAAATACSSESGFGGIEGSAHTSPPDGLPGPTAVPTTPQVTEVTASTATRSPAATLASTPTTTTPVTTTPVTATPVTATPVTATPVTTTPVTTTPVTTTPVTATPVTATPTPATAAVVPTVTFPRLADELEDYFGVEFEYDDYLCREAYSGGWDDYDCVRYDGGDPPSFYSPDLYCSGPKDWPECSKEWYPNQLEDYFGVEFDYDDYLCREAYSGGWDDYDCVRYDGGDPPSFYSPDLYCTDSYGSLECDPDHYPSERDGSGDDWDDWEGEFEDERDECWEDYWESEWEDECW